MLDDKKQKNYENSTTLGPQKCINVLWMNNLWSFCPASKLADTETCLDFDDGQHYQNIDRMDFTGAFWGQDDVYLPSSLLCNCFRPMVGEILAVVFAKLRKMENTAACLSRACPIMPATVSNKS
jgi:hypothetical protein